MDKLGGFAEPYSSNLFSRGLSVAGMEIGRR
jgi:hypothetical protein